MNIDPATQKRLSEFRPAWEILKRRGFNTPRSAIREKLAIFSAAVDDGIVGISRATIIRARIDARDKSRAAKVKFWSLDYEGAAHQWYMSELFESSPNLSERVLRQLKHKTESRIKPIVLKPGV